MADGANTWLVTIILGRLVPWALTALPNVIFQCCLPDRPYYSSMWQDLYEGRSVTEIDDLSGIIVQLAELQQMIPVPVNQALTRLVEEAQAAGKGLPCLSPDDWMRQAGLTTYS